MKNILHTTGKLGSVDFCQSSSDCKALPKQKGLSMTMGNENLPGFLNANNLHMLKNVPGLPAGF